MLRFLKNNAELADQLSQVIREKQKLVAENRTLKHGYSPEFVAELKEENYYLKKRVYELETALVSLESMIRRIVNDKKED